MAKPTISVRQLSKRYQLGSRAAHNTLRDQITDSVRRVFSRSGA